MSWSSEPGTLYIPFAMLIRLLCVLHASIAGIIVVLERRSAFKFSFVHLQKIRSGSFFEGEDKQRLFVNSVKQSAFEISTLHGKRYIVNPGNRQLKFRGCRYVGELETSYK